MNPTYESRRGRAKLTPLTDFQAFAACPSRQGSGTNLLLCTSWSQYTEFVWQRNLLYEEMSPNFMKCPAL